MRAYEVEVNIGDDHQSRFYLVWAMSEEQAAKIARRYVVGLLTTSAQPIPADGFDLDDYDGELGPPPVRFAKEKT